MEGKKTIMSVHNLPSFYEKKCIQKHNYTWFIHCCSPCSYLCLSADQADFHEISCVYAHASFTSIYMSWSGIWLFRQTGYQLHIKPKCYLPASVELYTELFQQHNTTLVLKKPQHHMHILLPVYFFLYLKLASSH